MMAADGQHTPSTAIERLNELCKGDLHDLCDAAEAAIQDGGGFGWLSAPDRHAMEAYWKGVLLVPERALLVARLDGTICGSAQLQRAARNNEAQAKVGQLTTFFLAPWARGHGLAGELVEGVEDTAREFGLKILNLDVRESQERAIQVYENLGYVRWGSNPHYALIDGTWMTGYYYYKDLTAASGEGARR